VYHSVLDIFCSMKRGTKISHGYFYLCCYTLHMLLSPLPCLGCPSCGLWQHCPVAYACVTTWWMQRMPPPCCYARTYATGLLLPSNSNFIMFFVIVDFVVFFTLATKWFLNIKLLYCWIDCRFTKHRIETLPRSWDNTAILLVILDCYTNF